MRDQQENSSITQKEGRLIEKTGATNKFVKALILEDSAGSVEAYMLDYSPIHDLRETISKCADLLSTVHFALRCELTNGL